MIKLAVPLHLPLYTTPKEELVDIEATPTRDGLDVPHKDTIITIPWSSISYTVRQRER